MANYILILSFRLARRAGVLARQINQEPVELALRGAISAGKTPGRIMQDAEFWVLSSLNATNTCQISDLAETT